MRAIALIDGEHAPDVVRQALRELPYDWVGAILAGGTEKLREGPNLESGAVFGVPLVEGLAGAEVLVDLSDEPVTSLDDRLRWASRALAAGLSYVGADFRFDPPVYEPFELPSIAVIGTGKRVGKTALSAHLARLLARDRVVAVVTMGRGGPPEPELVESPPDVASLLALSRSGRHAASDHLEIAAVAGVPTIGCRRAGGGLAGRPFLSSVPEGARLAAARAPDIVVFDGSGTSIPPVAVDRRVLVVGSGHDLTAGFDLYRRLISDLVITVGCVLPGAFAAELRVRPLGALTGRVAVFTAGPTATEHLDAEVVYVSHSLGDRATLQRQLASLEADTYLTELKGAAIDLVAEDASARGRQVVLAANDVVSPGLDEALLELVPAEVVAS